MEYLNDTSEPSILPFKLQEYLWQQTGAALKVKLTSGQSQHGGYESTCVTLERLILGHKTKELKVQVPEVYAAVISVPRWTFVKGALPYVIHCCAAVLEQRRSLGLSDKLSVAVTKLFATLHWILLESSKECCEDGSMLEPNVIELFIQTLVPVMHNLNESDLTFSLQSGILLWNPIWTNLPPISSILAIPVLDPAAASKVTPKNKRVGELSLQPSPTHSHESREIMTYFDIAVLKVLLLDSWTVNGYRWGLQYIQNYLQNVLSRNGFDSDNCQVMGILNKFTPRKSLASSLESGTDRQSPSLLRMPSLPQGDRGDISRDHKIKMNQKVPAHLLDYVSVAGELKLSFVLKIIKKLVKNTSLWSLSGSLLFVITQLTELALDTHKIINELKRHFESLLFCYVNVAKMLGCEHHCRNQMKCVKGDHYRLLLQDYFHRLVNSDIERAKIWFEKYAKVHDPDDGLEFLHSFLGFCMSTPQIVSSFSEEGSQQQRDGYNVNEGSYEYEPQGILHQSNYVEWKFSNEQLVLKWCSLPLFQRASRDWENIKNKSNIESYISFVQLSKYLRVRHNLIFRQIVMWGILNSFGKRKNVTESHESGASTPESRSSSSPTSPKLTPGKSFQDAVVKTGKIKARKNWFRKGEQKTVTEESFDQTVGSYPGTSSTLPHGGLIDQHLQDEKTGSLPRSFFKGKLKSGVSFDIPNQDIKSSNSAPEVKTKTTPQSPHKHLQQGKLINSVALYAGLKQLRCLLDLGDPGLIPEESIVAAMLDLEAPVLARASYLLELSYFVRCCNQDHWPTLMHFSQQGVIRKGIPHRNLLDGMKHRAGLLFHKWGVAIARKLDDIMLQEKLQHERRGNKQQSEEHVNFMYEGDTSVISSYCPQALRYVACQLLLEITAYLRETFVVAVQVKITTSSSTESPRTRTHTELSHTSSGGRKPRHSLATSIAKKISAVQRRKSSVGYLLNSQSDSICNDNAVTSSPTQVKVRRNASGVAIIKKSPKVSRKFSRKVSRTSFDHQASLYIEDPEELPDEMLDFPWLNVVIQMNKSINFLCAHGSEKCPEMCPIEQMKSCNRLLDVLKKLYENPESAVNQETKQFTKKTKDPVYKYLNDQVDKLIHIPFAVLCKGAFVMENLQLVETMAASWEVLLYPNHALRAAAASLFLVSGVRLEASVSNFLSRELTCSDAHERAKAVQRFGVLWDCQYQVYRHLEESAKITLRIPMLRLDYTIPSRPLGEEGESVPDAPWVADLNTHQDLDLSDDEDSFYYLDIQQQKEEKAKKRAKKLKKLRAAYFLTAVPFSYQSSVEYDIHEEEDTVVINTDTDGPLPFFPQSMSHGILHLIRLLDDTSLTSITGQSVGSLAYHIIWKCLVDHPETFFRRFFEKITHKIITKQEELIALLRKLLVHVKVLPPHAAHLLFNNLVGVVAAFDRGNRVAKLDRIAPIMPLLCQIATSVNNVYFGEMKQSLRREHIDHMFMVTANLACVKDVYVSYTQKEKLGILEDMTFKELLDQTKRIFEISSSENEIHHNFWLVDKHSGYIMENNAKIRDVYPYKRGLPTPVLKLEEFGDEHVFTKRQQQAVTNKLIHINQLVLSSTIFDKLSNKRHLIFLYSELAEKPSFAQKAFEVEFDLCMGSELGAEIFGLDVIFKHCWVKFISSLLTRLSEATFYGDEMIGLFLEPINGALLLHCEDVIILRTSLASLINIVRCYGKLFSLSAYEEILPVLLKVYSHHEDNQLIKEAIEFTVRQFYTIHQNQFILQMFASVAQILLTDDMIDISPEEQLNMVPARCLFSILESLNHDVTDKLDVMSLVTGEKPIKPYVDALEDDEKCCKVDLSIRLALTIIAYKAESSRALQMMFVLSGIIPYFLKHMASLTEANPTDETIKRNEMKQMKSMMKYVATIIEKNEQLSQNVKHVKDEFELHQKRRKFDREGSVTSERSHDNTLDGNTNFLWRTFHSAYSSVRNWFISSHEVMHDGDDIDRASIYEDGENPYHISPSNFDEQDALQQFYQPRTVLLFLASDFTLKCTDRYKILRKEIKSKTNAMLDIIEDENSLILLDVAMSLLRLTLKDHDVLYNAGLQRFLLEAMPCINWQPNLNYFHVIVKKIDSIFKKILSKPDYMRYAEWNNLEILIKGLYITMKKQECLAEVDEMKDLLHTSTKLMVADFNLPMFETTTPMGVKSPTSIIFNTTVIKLAARLLYIRPTDYSLKENFSIYVQANDTIVVERFLIHWLLPLCVRMGTCRFDYPSMASDDIHFVASVLMSILHPQHDASQKHIIGPIAVLATVGVQLGRQQSITPSLENICFLGFKILLVAYSDYFGCHWKVMKTTFLHHLNKNAADYTLWSFISFLVSNRLPLLIHLLPTIRLRLSKIPSDASDRVKQLCSRIKHDLSSPPVISSRATILQNLLNELSALSHTNSNPKEMSQTLGSGNEYLLKDPPPGRTPETEEDDEAYIARIKREKTLRETDSIGSNMSRDKSILRRAVSHSPQHSGGEKVKLRKQVSFHDSVPSDKSSQSQPSPETSAVHSDPKHLHISPIRRQLAKLSKRSKLRILKQPRTDEGDHEMIVTNEGIHSEGAQHDGDELVTITDGRQISQQVISPEEEIESKSNTEAPYSHDQEAQPAHEDEHTDESRQLLPQDSIDSKTTNGKQRRFGSVSASIKPFSRSAVEQTDMFYKGPETEKDVDEKSLPKVSESKNLSVSNEPHVIHKSLSLSRSPVVKRKAPDAEIQIHGIPSRSDSPNAVAKNESVKKKETFQSRPPMQRFSGFDDEDVSRIARNLSECSEESTL